MFYPKKSNKPKSFQLSNEEPVCACVAIVNQLFLNLPDFKSNIPYTDQPAQE
jgi:hypothetical protein